MQTGASPVPYGFYQMKLHAELSLPCVKGGVERSETEGL